MYLVMLISRKKDNLNLKNFKSRTKEFLWNDELKKEFEDFTINGEIGEISRLYISVNEKNVKYINKNLIHFLLDNPDYNINDISKKIVHFASQPECDITHKWLIDFDNRDENDINQFLKYLPFEINELKIKPTVSGYGVVVPNRFDTRRIIKDWSNIENKKSSYLLNSIGYNNNNVFENVDIQPKKEILINQISEKINKLNKTL